MAKPAPKIDAATRARDFQHCIDDLPYRSVVFIKLDGNNTPVYQVAGANNPAVGARKALERAFDLYGGKCFYCGKDKPADHTIDHVEPSAIGGRDTLQNLVVACKPCNTSKGHKPIELFNPKAGRAWLEAVLQQVEERLRRLPR